jgi:hypothetical protein
VKETENFLAKEHPKQSSSHQDFNTLQTKHRSPKKLPKHPNQAIQTPNHSKTKITVLECETTIYQCKRNQTSLERRDEPLKDHRRQELQHISDAIAMVHQSIGGI